MKKIDVIKVAIKKAWSNEEGTALVPDGHEDARVLVATEGMEVIESDIERFENADEFFTTQEGAGLHFSRTSPTFGFVNTSVVHTNDPVTPPEQKNVDPNQKASVTLIPADEPEGRPSAPATDNSGRRKGNK